MIRAEVHSSFLTRHRISFVPVSIADQYFHPHLLGYLGLWFF
jgi:hypothetical protein